ncbi:type 2 lanthipeptide synthetase LanM family protein [Streptomyces himastatinicus]|uniref:type 2 lanthipeptide synthetase LanM family protein n=1 Tax=Streptomyces himastatinicus TaxID=998084 RepID=UPI0002F1B88F|nr:type 2 lanthipeptide synthetase LanM family protein [Streptomyces himastatinicus]
MTAGDMAGDVGEGGREEERCEAGQPGPYEPSLDADGRLRDYFRHFVKPWADWIRESVRSSPVVDSANTIADDFLRAQTVTVAELMIRTMVGELYARRSRGLLDGQTPEERYESFRQWTNSEAGHRELTDRYPLLFRTVSRRTEESARYLLTVVREVEYGAWELPAPLPVGEIKVSAIELGEGDTHNGGKSVARVVFTDGSRVIYKPRSMASEAGFNAFVAWMNGELGLGLRTVATLPVRHGGFAEFIPTQEHTGGAENYFAQVGSLAGILFLLKATDIHFENMVTCADGPVVVDAETLFTPTPRTRETGGDGAAPSPAPGLATRVLRESVVGTGLLPMVIRARGSGRGMDVGAIGYDAGQRLPYKVLELRNRGRDDMYVAMAAKEMTRANGNVAVQRATGPDVRVRRDLIKAEFRRVLEHAAAHPHRVMDAVERFLGDAQFRFVSSPTLFYGQLLRMATHPDAITSPLVRAAVLHRVALRTTDVPGVVEEEVRQLAAGDVPYFSYTARSRALTAQGRTVCADALEEAPLDSVRDRILRLDTTVIERELDLIDFSFVDKLPTEPEQTGFKPRAGGARNAVGESRYLAEAERIGDRLVATQIGGADPLQPATWIAPQVTTDSQSQWTPGPLGYDLYGGSPGPALVLAALAHETGRRDYADAARRVLDPIERQLRGDHLDDAAISVGGMTGMAGTVYAIAVGRELLGDRDGTRLSDLAGKIARRCGPDALPDYVSGMAGTLAVCMALYGRAESADEKRAVEESVRTVAAAEVAVLGGTDRADARVTGHTGLAHGAMGIGPVLIQYGTVFDDPAARRLGVRITGAVVDAYDERDGDWPREWGGDRRSYGWCHGAPGLLQGGLLAVSHAPSAVPVGALARCAELTLDRGFGNNPTYCHGDLASADILAEAERQLPGLVGDVAEDIYPRLFAEVVEQYEKRADNKYAYSNSLLVGQAGLAWSILRHLDPVSYPSVLWLE